MSMLTPFQKYVSLSRNMARLRDLSACWPGLSKYQIEWIPSESLHKKATRNRYEHFKSRLGRVAAIFRQPASDTQMESLALQ
jgi:hypothetical protein